MQYGFRDLLVLRTVGALHAARVPTRSIHRAFRDLAPWLSEAVPLSRIALVSMADRVAVDDGSSQWEPASGQYALPLEVRRLESHILQMKKAKNPPQSRSLIDTAHEHYLRGADLEESDAAAAKSAYEACLAGDCAHLEARINLGRLLHLEGRHREAEAVYGETQEPSAIRYFNLAILQEDLGNPQAAVANYLEAIVHDPGMADAHFNLALLQERAGETQAAFRHLLAYRRLTQAGSGEL